MNKAQRGVRSSLVQQITEKMIRSNQERSNGLHQMKYICCIPPIGLLRMDYDEWITTYELITPIELLHIELITMNGICGSKKC